ncbi:molybdenum cofactor biosynthesis protein MoaD [Ralstonia sp. A12]|uniref:molybdopterin converting factor subunit 1 n=1 Tax=Ralstonia sp. A12 TaxID=1217052 RepID=UPI0005757AA5|nr:molybdopterin converting factor subunit 1 [Ralstonia sp. A12]KHK58983.1 molybdenum cofactor biosynthesis protein MoaD [Ralstonia sp. A12]
MQIELRFFASVREQLGTSQEVVIVPDTVRTLGDVRHWLAQRGPVWSETLAQGRALRMALDHQILPADTALHEGCEVAIFPPVTGG